MIHFADLHLHPFKDFNRGTPGNNSRLKFSFLVFDWIIKLTEQDDGILTFSGDLIHEPNSMPNEVFTQLMHLCNKYFGQRKSLVKMVMISGNHDMSNYNGLDNSKRSSSYIKALSELGNIYCADFTSITLQNTTFWGCPYMNNPKDTLLLLQDFHKHSKLGDYLLIHSDLPGAVTPQGIHSDELDEELTDSFRKLTRHYKLVLAGHIHQHQQIYDNTYMIGAPLQKDRGEAKAITGVMISDPKRGKVRHIHTPGTFPQFIMGDPDPTDTLNYYTPVNATLMEEQEGDFEGVVQNISRKALVNGYAKSKNLSKKKTKFLHKLIGSL